MSLSDSEFEAWASRTAGLWELEGDRFRIERTEDGGLVTIEPLTGKPVPGLSPGKVLARGRPVSDPDS